MCRSARLSQANVRADGSGSERVSGRLFFGMVEEACRFLRTPAGLVWPDVSDNLDVYQEPGIGRGGSRWFKRPESEVI